MSVAAGSRLGTRLSFLLTAGVLTLAVTAGGGQGTLGDTAVQLLSIALLGALVVHAGLSESLPLPAWTWWPVLAVIAVPLLQSLPIPEPLWRSLGGRAHLAEQLAVAGVAPWPRWGLHPLGSERALFWLLPAVAIYLSVLRLPRPAQRRLVTLLLLLAALSVLLGLAQLAGGADSPLRLYANTNRSAAVGFFANRNHFAGLLALCLPLALAWTARAAIERHDDRGVALLRIVAGVGLCLLLILGLAITRSRAGLLLGMIAVVLALPLLLLRAQRRRGPHRMVRAVLLTATVAAMQVALFAVLQRFGPDPIDEDRWGYADTTLQAARAYAPLGSGLGTFRQAYQPFEREGPGGSGRAVVNHAHNDYLEAWLEAGWLMPPVAALVIGTLGFAAVRAWRVRDRRSDGDTLQQRAAVVAVLIPLLHSLVDYPLRTSAHLAVFGLVAGLVVAAALPDPHLARRPLPERQPC